MERTKIGSEQSKNPEEAQIVSGNKFITQEGIPSERVRNNERKRFELEQDKIGELGNIIIICLELRDLQPGTTLPRLNGPLGPDRWQQQ